FAVRYVELENRSGAGHFAVEAWCNELGKWVLLDPLNAAIYVRDGVPLSAVEIHDELLGGQEGSVHVNRVPIATGAPSSGKTRGGASSSVPSRSASGTSDAELMSFFYNVAVSTRNDSA